MQALRRFHLANGNGAWHSHRTASFTNHRCLLKPMHRQPSPLPRLLLFAFAALLFATGQAQAKRGFMLITTGTTHSEIGPVSKDMLQAMKEELGVGIPHCAC